jgi:signal transduction histidine kinase
MRIDQLSEKQMRSFMVSQLMDGFMHELANDLRSIVMDANALTREAACRKSNSAMMHLKSLLSTAERVDSVIQRYKMFLNQEVGRSESDIVRVAQRTFELLAKHKRVKLHLSAKAEAAICEVSEEQLQQVFINIILNSVAAGATTVKIVVEVCAGKGEKEAVIQLVDDGIGMEEDVRRRACEPFFTTRPSGTGLGLYISRQILIRHGGDLSIASSQGNGTAITIHLPVLEAWPANTAADD